MFGKSENFKEEYCCSIIRVGEIKPIVGKDKIGFTLVNGESIAHMIVKLNLNGILEKCDKVEMT